MSRIARAKHETPVSRILSIAVKVLKREENASPVIYDTTPRSSGRRSDCNSHDARALPARYRRLRHGGALPTSHGASRHHVVRRRRPKLTTRIPLSLQNSGFSLPSLQTSGYSNHRVGAMGWDALGRPRSNDSPPKAVAASHAEAVDRSNILHPIGYHYSHEFFAHGATTD
jgi:hypothetical protein